VKGKGYGRKRSILWVHRTPGKDARGVLRTAGLTVPVALGRSGIAANKREGDGATPRGRLRLLRLWWRADRLPRPATLLPVRRIRPDDAWCEDPADRRYNRPIKLSLASNADRLWRDDHLYDLVIELDHNTRPRITGRGSAIFIHVAQPGLTPTAGCVALPARQLKNILARLHYRAVVEIG
jgi:L,D-peptidoglycan transpeptidase YkuD (ErfK/YbiS/YcfS/YnhG family)